MDRPENNVQQVIPFLSVKNMDASLAYYRDGLGFKVVNRWVVDEAIHWCMETRRGRADASNIRPGKGAGGNAGRGHLAVVHL
jgi:catechol 2,3-dioxygenase-like lactoylglutathione lyase family enzyme